VVVPFHFGAEPLGRRGIGKRSRLNPVIDSLLAEVGANGDSGQLAEQIGV